MSVGAYMLVCSCVYLRAYLLSGAIPCGPTLSIHRKVRSCTVLNPHNYTLCLQERDPDQTGYGLRSLLSTLDCSYNSRKLGILRSDCTTQRILFGTALITQVTYAELDQTAHNIQLIICRFPCQSRMHFCLFGICTGNPQKF